MLSTDKTIASQLLASYLKKKKKSIKSNGHKQSLKGPGGQKEGVRNCAPPWSSLLWPLCLYLLICFLLSLTHMVGTEHGGKAVGFSSTWRPCSSRWGKRWWAKRQEMHPNPKSLLGAILWKKEPGNKAIWFHREGAKKPPRRFSCGESSLAHRRKTTEFMSLRRVVVGDGRDQDASGRF